MLPYSAPESSPDRRGARLSRRAALIGGGAIAAAATAAPFGGFTTGVAAAAPRNHEIPPRSDDVVYASDHGFDPADATDALQSALDSSAATVVIDDVGAEWLTRPLFVNRDDVTVLLAPGVVVRALPGGYPEQQMCLLSVIGRSGVSIVGYSASMIMNKAEYGDDGQWRHVINIMSGRQVRVEGLLLAESGGDGIYVGKSKVAGDPHHSEDITIRNVTCDANYRQGMSVVGVDGLLAEGCRFSNTLGHNPQAGVDFEPNDADQPLAGIELRDCVLEGNQSYQLVVSLHAYDQTSPPLDILVNRTRIGGAPGQARDLPVVLYSGSKDGPLSGRVEIRDSLLLAGPYAGCFGSWDQDGAELVLTRTVCHGLGGTFDGYPPLSIRAFDEVPVVGGMTVIDGSVLADHDGPAFEFITRGAVSPDLGVHDIHGNVTVVNPNGVSVDFEPNPTDVTLEVRALAAMPAAVVEIATGDSQLRARRAVTVTVTRDGADLAAPLAVRYRTEGTAAEREDIFGTAGMVVVPPGESEASFLVRSRATAVGQAVTFVIEPDGAYTVGAADRATVQFS